VKGLDLAMRLRFDKLVLVFGWFLVVMGIVYLAQGGLGAIAQIPGSLPRMVLGLATIVVGCSIVGWVKHYGMQ
jgi:hypothetical protein